MEATSSSAVTKPRWEKAVSARNLTTVARQREWLLERRERVPGAVVPEVVGAVTAERWERLVAKVLQLAEGVVPTRAARGQTRPEEAGVLSTRASEMLAAGAAFSLLVAEGPSSLLCRWSSASCQWCRAAGPAVRVPGSLERRRWAASARRTLVVSGQSARFRQDPRDTTSLRWLQYRHHLLFS